MVFFFETCSETRSGGALPPPSAPPQPPAVMWATQASSPVYGRGRAVISHYDLLFSIGILYINENGEG